MKGEGFSIGSTACPSLHTDAVHGIGRGHTPALSRHGEKHYSVLILSIGFLVATRQLCTTTVTSTMAVIKTNAAGKSHQ